MPKLMCGRKTLFGFMTPWGKSPSWQGAIAAISRFGSCRRKLSARNLNHRHKVEGDPGNRAML